MPIPVLQRILSCRRQVVKICFSLRYAGPCPSFQAAILEERRRGLLHNPKHSKH